MLSSLILVFESTDNRFLLISPVNTSKFDLICRGAYLNCLKFNDCLDFQLHFQYCMSINSFTKIVNVAVIFIISMIFVGI